MPSVYILCFLLLRSGRAGPSFCPATKGCKNAFQVPTKLTGYLCHATGRASGGISDSTTTHLVPLCTPPHALFLLRAWGEMWYTKTAVAGNPVGDMGGLTPCLPGGGYVGSIQPPPQRYFYALRPRGSILLSGDKRMQKRLLWGNLSDEFQKGKIGSPIPPPKHALCYYKPIHTHRPTHATKIGL